MDSNFALIKIQNLSSADIDELLEIVKSNINVSFVDIVAVGSRVRDDFTQMSDLDIVVFTDEINNYETPRSVLLQNLRVSIFLKNTKFIDNYNVYGQFHLSSYSLLNKEFHQGSDDNAFLEWKFKPYTK